MAKGVSIKFTSYEENISKLLELVNLSKELPKHDKIVLKVSLRSPNANDQRNTNVKFVEPILRYCLSNKNSVAEIFIAEGADGYETRELFDSLGYRELAEKYSIGLIDLNDTEVEQIELYRLLRLSKVMYPKILKDSFIISLASLAQDEESIITGSLSNMIGAYPAKHYQGFFSSVKNKIKKFPIKYAIHDILRCKMPEFAIIDASKYGKLLAGIPLDMDKAAAALIGIKPENVPYISLVDEMFVEREEKKKDEKEII